MEVSKLVYMANQIARNLAAQGPDKATAAVAEHIRLFWDPRMKATIIAHDQHGGEGLDPLVRSALARL